MKKCIILQINYLILICLFIPCVAIAQPICQIQRFSAYNGLAQRSVTNILQDSKGFIWFSTWNGLNKFDGYTFKNYKAFPGDGCTLTSNRLAKITQTQTCDIWCQTYDLRIYHILTAGHGKNHRYLTPIMKTKNSRPTLYRTSIHYPKASVGSYVIVEHSVLTNKRTRLRKEKE